EFLASGAWTKRLHPGWAALAGLHAATLARAGFRAPTTILEGRSGFLHAYSDGADPAALEGSGDYELLRTSVKPHACCRYMQGPIDGALALRARHHLDPADVERIEVGMLAAGHPIVCEPLDAKRRPSSTRSSGRSPRAPSRKRPSPASPRPWMPSARRRASPRCWPPRSRRFKSARGSRPSPRRAKPAGSPLPARFARPRARRARRFQLESNSSVTEMAGVTR